MYVWVPLLAPSAMFSWHARRSSGHIVEQAVGIPELQVHLRLQWLRNVERGQTMHMDISLEGLGLSVVGYVPFVPSCHVILTTPLKKQVQCVKWYAEHAFGQLLSLELHA